MSLLILLCFSPVIQTASLSVQFALSVEGDREFSIPIPNFSNFGKRPKIDSIDKWLTAFGIYASIVVEKFPHKASQFFAYQRIIREASQKFKGLAWYSYDIAFRKLAAENPALNWGEHHLQLWLDKFTELLRDQFVSSAAARIIFLIYALFPHQGLEVTGHACPTTVPSAAISTGESHAQRIHVPSHTAVTMQTVADDTAPMTLRVAENTSKDFVDG